MVVLSRSQLSRLTRRDLIAGGSVLGMGGLGVASALASNGPDHGSDDVRFVAQGTTEPEATSETATEASPPAAEKIGPATILETATIRDLRDGMDSGAFTAVELMDAVLARIERLDAAGPEINAIIELVDDAREQAQAADDRRAAGEPLGLLHGIPILLKDIVATADSTRTTAGSFTLEENVVVRDAYLAERLREAGAILLGKTNLTEWSNYKGGGLPSGYSPRGGQTVNPYDPERSPSGSSSGSAAAVAAGYVPATIGAEFNGSIVTPAAYCGVVGLKPTVGLVSRSGLIPISIVQDGPGPITRTVEDAAIMLSVIAGLDPEDPINGDLADYAPAARFDESPIPEPGTADYTAGLREDALDGARIGVYSRLFGFDPRVDALVEEVLALMEEAGAELVTDVPEGNLDAVESYESRYAIVTSEFRHMFAQWCETYTPDGPILDMDDVVAYNDAHPEEELEGGDQSGLIDVANAPYELDDPEYLELLEEYTTLTRDEGLDAILDEAGVEILVAPSAGLAPRFDGTDGVESGSSSSFSAFAGYPSITVPIGLIDGLPAGIHFFGRAFSEQTLLAIAYATEQLVGRIDPPSLPAEE